MVLEFILEELVVAWSPKGMGFTFDRLGVISHAICCDNTYLFAKSLEE